MKRPIFFCLILMAAGLLSGCGDHETERTALPGRGDTLRVVFTPSARQFRGVVVLGHEMRSFRDAETGRAFWVSDPGGDLTARYGDLAGEPYQPLWAELAGEVSGEPDAALAADFDSLLTVQSVLDLRGPGAGSVPAFRTAGNEPFWSVTTAPGTLTLTRLGAPEPLVFAAGPPLVAPGVWVFSGRRTGDGLVSLQLFVEAGPCPDTMADKEWTWSALVVLDDHEVLRGCGEPWTESDR